MLKDGGQGVSISSIQSSWLVLHKKSLTAVIQKQNGDSKQDARVSSDVGGETMDSSLPSHHLLELLDMELGRPIRLPYWSRLQPITLPTFLPSSEL